MKAQVMRPSRIGGGVLQWVLTVIALAAVGVVIYVSTKPVREKDPAPVMVARTPEPAPVAPATKVTPPLVAAPTPTPAPPTPAPVVKATPTPTPTPAAPALDLATVAQTPSLWPPVVALLQPVTLPVMVNGRAAGQAKVPAGATLRLVRVLGDKVEVEYQKTAYALPAASTDLLQRALAKIQSGGAPVAENRPQGLNSGAPSVNAEPSASPASAKNGGEPEPVKFGKRMAVDVSLAKATRIEGGDFDDKKDRFRLKVKITNQDTSMSAQDLKAEIFVFGESMTDRNIRHVLANESFTFSLPVRGIHEMATKEVATAYDDSQFARFGYKYESWFLRIRNKDGILILEKSNLPSLMKFADKINGLQVGMNYDRKTFAGSKSTSTR